MPEIEGLKEQQAALKRVKDNLKEVADINTFLKSVADLSKDENVQASHSILISFDVGEDIKRFKCPLLIQDNHYILDAAQKYKEEIVRKVRQDSSEYRIALSPKDNATLDWTLV